MSVDESEAKTSYRDIVRESGLVPPTWAQYAFLMVVCLGVAVSDYTGFTPKYLIGQKVDLVIDLVGAAIWSVLLVREVRSR